MGSCASVIRKKEEQRKHIYPLNIKGKHFINNYQKYNDKYNNSINKYSINNK